MKQVYCVWAYDNYYPTGPGDLKGVYTSHKEADKWFAYYQKRRRYDYVEITIEDVKEDEEGEQGEDREVVVEEWQE